MLSYKQFTDKHKVKFQNLPVVEIRRRYSQYQSSQRNVANGTGNKSKQGASTAPKQRNNRATRGVSLVDPNTSPFLRLVSNPFITNGVGLPVFPSPPSSKITTWFKSTFTCGPGGAGFAMFAPTIDTTVANSAVTTNSGFVGPALSNASGGTGLVFGNCATGNNTLTAVSFSNNPTLQQRLVCAGVRFRYTGTNQNMAGSMLAFVHPEHADVNAYTKAYFMGFEGVSYQPVTRDWVSAVWVPVHRTELDYNNSSFPPSLVTANATGYQLCVHVPDGIQNNTYDVEYFQHYELIGTTTGDKTENPVSANTEPILSRLRGSVANYTGKQSRSRTNFGGAFSTLLAGLGTAARMYNNM